MDHHLFQIALKRRLRMQIFDSDSFCLSCGDCMDSFGDHALVCMCKGDRTVRHNALPNIVHDVALTAGLRPEKEKAGLLPPRPDCDGIQVTNGTNRRPADVFLPLSPQGMPEALDFACSSGLRAEVAQRAVDNPQVVFDEYEEFKRSYQNTDQACSAQGLRFTPMIIEAHSGAWSPSARKIFDFISKSAASAANAESLRFAQRTSIALHRENARAISRRLMAPADPQHSCGWDGWTLD